MCLIVSPKHTKKNKTQLQKYKYMTYYKKINRFLKSPVYSHAWVPGYNKSDVLTKDIMYSNTVYKGIHVYTTKAEARISRRDYGGIIIPVRCYYGDFIAASDENTAVFTKVFLYKKDYLQAKGNQK